MRLRSLEHPAGGFVGALGEAGETVRQFTLTTPGTAKRRLPQSESQASPPERLASEVSTGDVPVAILAEYSHDHRPQLGARVSVLKRTFGRPLDGEETPGRVESSLHQGVVVVKISVALDKIDENQLFVPAFQREYVWKRDDAKQLVDSLIKEYPTGTMLTWETNNPPELKGPHKYNEKQGAVRILLDGQQRLTTLYMLIRGTLPPYYTEPEILNDTRGLYVNVETHELGYYKRLQMENDPRWQNLTDLFQRKIRVPDITRALEEMGQTVDRAREDKIYDNLRAVELILDRDFPEQTVPVRASVREAIDIFYKVNASGVSLTDAELALAQISGYWPEARDIFKAKLFELEKRGFRFKLDFIVYVLLGCLHYNGSDMRKLHDAENNEAIRDAWQRLNDQVLDYVINVMQSHAYVDHTDEINSPYALVPIIVYCFHKPTAHLSDLEIRKLVKWFYYSQVRTRYVSQLPQKLDHDLRIVRDTEHPFDELLAVIKEDRRLEITPDEFEGRSILHPLYGLMKWYLKSQGAYCLTTGVKLRQPMGKKYKIENDHIFPFSRLKAAGYGKENRLRYSLAQELTNRALLTQLANRTKSAATAEEYLAEVVDRYPDGLRKQCIPEDESLWRIDNFEEFLRERRRRLAEEMNAFLEGITETELPEAPITLEEMIAEGESEELEYKETVRWDVKEGKVNKRLEDAIVKTVAAFANSQGGTLLIGVSDDQQPVGLESDYKALGGADRDRFELHLRNLLAKHFGQFQTSKVKISFPCVGDIEICEVDVEKAKQPQIVSLPGKDGVPAERLYARSGNSSREIPIGEMQVFLAERFPQA